MALTAGEQAALDQIEEELTRTDSYLAAALASFATPPDPASVDPLVENLRTRLRSPWTVVSLLGAFILFVLAVVCTQPPTGRCADPTGHPSCADVHRTSAASAEQ